MELVASVKLKVLQKIVAALASEIQQFQDRTNRGKNKIKLTRDADFDDHKHIMFRFWGKDEEARKHVGAAREAFHQMLRGSPVLDDNG